jgi:hypothetical protein
MKLIDKDALIAEIERLIEQDYPCDTFEESTGYYNALDEIATFIDTLEVKEVDEVKIGETQIYLEDDGGEPPYDSKQWLDLSCTEYEIPKALFKDGDNVEIFIRKTQKGE